MHPAALRIVDLRERDTRVFPREELFDQQGRTLILPETRALPAIELREIFSGVELRALGLIGWLPLTGTIALNLRPKFPTQNFWRLLAGLTKPTTAFFQFFDPTSGPKLRHLISCWCGASATICAPSSRRGSRGATSKSPTRDTSGRRFNSARLSAATFRRRDKRRGARGELDGRA